MKALVLEAYKTLLYKEVPDPDPGPGEVKVRIKATGICGSDVHGYDGTSGRRIPPMIMGHESSGVIHQVGEGVKKWQSGDRVTFDSTIYDVNDWFSRRGQYNLSENRRVLGVSCKEYKQDGAFAEYLVIPEHILYPLPASVTFEEAALAEPVAVALHAVNLSKSDPENHIMVVGSGIIGLLIIQVLRSREYQHIYAVDIDASRLEYAAGMGADFTLNPQIDDVCKIAKQHTEYKGMDCVIDAAGIQKTLDLSFQCIRKGGTMVLVGNIAQEVKMPLQKIVTEQLTMQGSCAISGEYPEALRLLDQKKIDVDQITSRIVPLSEGAIWFDRLYHKEKGLLKVILTP
jgi:L-iditol 2-dehydrogenase